jgi:UDP-glucose 4-epimerase
MFADKTLLVTGGTGSFGHTLIEALIDEHAFKQIVVFSRDEKKQNDMRLAFANERLRFVIGDVRDREAVFAVMRGVDYVFHAAALKHVPVCEFFPMEAVKTNILGAHNVLDAAEHSDVEKVVVLSTDKAVYPVNAMGMSKAMMEKLLIAKSRESRSNTVFCGVRYGNVMYSRGSVIPLFVQQIRAGVPLTVTHPDMTRFLLPLPHAIDLVSFALEKGNSGDLFVRKSPASTTGDIARACLDVFKRDLPISEIGIREGEKMHETLVTWEESLVAEDMGEYFRIRSDRTERYEDYLSHGRKQALPKEGYTSTNTRRLGVPETAELLLSLKEIQEAL